MTRTVTLAILATLTGLLVAWDIWLAVDGVPRNTISEALLWLSQRSSVVPFLFGVLCGHLFWPQEVRR